MGEPVRIADHPRWGPAELAAIDRCLAIPSTRPPETRPRQSRLSRLIETEIIPRLMLAHQAEPQVLSEPPAQRVGTSEVAELATLALGSDSHSVSRLLQTLLARGIPIEVVLLDGLGGAARLLGDMWREDLCTFGDVTIGLANLQQVVRTLGSEFDVAPVEPAGGRILLAAMPGEQHRFGVSILDTMFRRDGWDSVTADTLEDMRSLLHGEWFDVVGLSLSSDVLFDRVKPTIQALRRASENPSLFVMVGGRFFVDHPERSAEVGADTVAIDAHDALRLAQPRSGSRLARC